MVVVKPNCGRVVEGVNKEVAVTTARALQRGKARWTSDKHSHSDADSNPIVNKK